MAVLSWVLPMVVAAIVAVLLALVPALFRLSNRLALTEERTERNDEDIEKECLRNNAQDEKLAGMDKVLTRVDANVTQIVRALERSGLI